MRPLTQIVNLSALAQNFAQLRSLAPASKIVAVVKADVYGCGLTVLDALTAADYFAVACLEEAVAIRRAGHDKPIILLEGWFDEAEVTVTATENFIPVIATSRQFDWLMASEHTFSEVWVKVDTGMTRLGFLPEQIEQVLSRITSRYDSNRLVLMTHLSSADECAQVTKMQLDAFDSVAKYAPNVRQCVCNSTGTIRFTQAQRDIVRLGIALYGASPIEAVTTRPVVTLRTEVISVKHCPTDTHVGYGHTVTLTKPTDIAVIAIGYADGYPREYQTPPPVWINGNFYRVTGRISMDMMMVEVDCTVSVGDEVELWGEQLRIEDVAKAIGTIPYTLLTNMATRVHQRYMSEQSVEIH